ncbi:hypothetical protein Ancab_037099 [Ancistrocladus abbreviatus]
MDTKQKHTRAIVDRRPQMLKDFLRDDLNNSCSSSGFKTFPRKPYDSTTKNLLKHDHPQAPNSLRRSRSRAAEATISVLQKLLSVFKSSSMLNLAVDDSPLTPLSLSRNLSRRLWRRWLFTPAKPIVNDFTGTDENGKIKVKDILRSRSFRDLINETEELKENFQPLDSQTSTAGSTSDRASSSGDRRSWSWAESEFSITVDALPRRWANSSEVKSLLDGRDPMEEATGNKYHVVGPVAKVPIEGKEQHSPVSVLDSPFGEEEKFSPSVDQSLANVERTKMRLLESMHWFASLGGVETASLKQFSVEEDTNLVNNQQEEDKQNGAEGRALVLMEHIRALGSKEVCGANIDQLLFDFFVQELTENNKVRKEKKLEDIVEKEAKAYPSRLAPPLECEVQEIKERESCLECMEREVQWGKFTHEQDDLALNLEILMLNALLDELLFDLIGCSWGRRRQHLNSVWAKGHLLR